MSAKFIFLKGRSHVTLNMHPRIPAQTSAALTKALAAVLMAASVLLTGCVFDGGPESPSLPRSQAVILRLAETMPENHPSAQAMAYFAEMVSRETQGRVTVKIYYNGSLGTPTEIIEQVKFGGIAMARVNVLELSEEVESIRKYFVPSNFAGGDAQTEWIHSNEETLRDECQMDRITPLVWYYPDFRCFYGTDATFLDKKDLEGKKIESSESALMAEIFRDMGIELAGSVNTNTYKSLISGNISTEGEYRRGHLNGFRNIPLDDLREHLDELERDKPVYVNCQTGLRSYLACRLLTQYGFSCSHLSGGYSFYQVVTQEQQTARSAYPCGKEKL